MNLDTRPRLRRRTRALALLLTWVAAASLAADSSAERRIEMLLVPRTADAVSGDGSILIEGRVAPVVERRPVAAGSWRIRLTVDEPLVQPSTLEDLSRRLLDEVEALAVLGTVTVTQRGTGRVELIESADPDEIAGALVELAQSADRAGEYFERRHELESALRRATTAAERRRLLIDHYHRERELLLWQHQTLLEEALLESAPSWMVEGGGRNEGPLALWMVRDDLGADTLEFLTGRLRAVLGDGTQRQGQRLDRAEIDAEVELLESRLGPLDQRSREEIEDSAALLSSTGAALIVTCGTCSGEDSRAARLLPDATTADLDLLGALLDDGGSETLPRLAAASRWFSMLPADLPSGELLAVNLADAFRRDGARTAWIAPTPPSALTVVRARRFLEGLDQGDLVVEAGILGGFGGGGTLETLLDVDSLGSDAPADRRLRVSMVQRSLDADLDFELLFGGRPDLQQERWLLRSPVRLERDLDRVAVVVEDLETGTWGAAVAGELQASLETAGAGEDSVQIADVGTSVLPATLRTGRVTTPEPESEPAQGTLIGERRDQTSSGRDRPAVLQLVAPTGDPLTGKQRFSVLAATTAVRSVAFYLGDEEIDRDDRAPFAATVDLGSEVREQTVRAVAYSGSGLLLGSDEVRVNRPRLRSGLRLTSVAPGEESGASVLVAEASLGLDQDQELQRVEFYRNQALIATLTRPPLRAAVGAPPDADAAARGDFVRVVAWLADGSFLEDVRLLGLGGDGAVGEQVEVNLVQVFAVVTDQNGDPVEGLEAEAFDLRLDGDPVSLERFSKAEQVPLDLALVVDTSTSMWPLMDDTRKAAARFLGQTVSEQDRAMLIDFDDRVRTVHPLSTEVFSLIEGLSRLRASGATALYDSIIYALVSLEEAARSRRAVVLLTDGSDFNSRFGYARVYESAESAGVPLYFVALSDYFGESRRSPRKTDLEAFAEASGGRVFYVQSMEDILASYERISRELRSQYLLTFTTDRELTLEQLQKLRVRLGEGVADRRRLEVRWTVGSGR